MPGSNELVKKINRVRDYVREFFVFGWRSRSEYNGRSSRSYDNEKRRIESWFGENFKGYATEDKRSVFTISFAGEEHLYRNPLYEIWRTKTFTAKDMFLHFAILDLLSRDVSSWACSRVRANVEPTAECMAEEISMADGYGEDIAPDTVRIKLDEYCENGIIQKRTSGGKKTYSLYPASWKNISDISENAMASVDFFTEASPLGVIGSYIQDGAGRKNEFFSFSHDFMAQTLDDEVLFALLCATRERHSVTIKIKRNDGGAWVTGEESGVPLRILTSVESGRRYVAMMKDPELIFWGLETIDSVEQNGTSPNFHEYRGELEKYLRKCWSVDFEQDAGKRGGNVEHVQMRLSIKWREMRVLRRLLDEGRNGIVTVETPGVYVYRNKLWDAREILPFVMSFAGHVISFKSDNKEAEKIFRDNIEKMSAIYQEESDI